MGLFFFATNLLKRRRLVIIACSMRRASGRPRPGLTRSPRPSAVRPLGVAPSRFDFQIPPGGTFRILKEKISSHPSLPCTIWRSGLCQREEWKRKIPHSIVRRRRKKREYGGYPQIRGEFIKFLGCSPAHEGLQGKPLDV